VPRADVAGAGSGRHGKGPGCGCSAPAATAGVRDMTGLCKAGELGGILLFRAVARGQFEGKA